MKKRIKPTRFLPTLVCAWCNHVIRPGASKVSHGICHNCAAHFFHRLRPGRRRVALAARAH